MALSSLSSSSSHSTHYIKNAIKNYIPISSSISKSNTLQEEKENERMIINMETNDDDSDIINDHDYQANGNIKINGQVTSQDKVTLTNNDVDTQNEQRLSSSNGCLESSIQQPNHIQYKGQNFSNQDTVDSPNKNKPRSIVDNDDPNTTNLEMKNNSDSHNNLIMNGICRKSEDPAETKLIDCRVINNNNNYNVYYEDGEPTKTEILEIPSVIIHGASDIYDPTKTIVCYHNNHNTHVYNDTTIPVATTPMRLGNDINDDDEEDGEKERTKLKLRKKLSSAELAKRRQRKKSSKNCKIFFYTAIASSCSLILYLIYHSLFT